MYYDSVYSLAVVNFFYRDLYLQEANALKMIGLLFKRVISPFSTVPRIKVVDFGEKMRIYCSNQDIRSKSSNG